MDSHSNSFSESSYPNYNMKIFDSCKPNKAKSETTFDLKSSDYLYMD